MTNFKVPICKNGRVTLLTGGKYCDRDIDVTVNVAGGGDTETAYEQGVTDGKQAEYDRFWDEYQNNGTRSIYELAFAGNGWTDETFDPKYPIVVNGSSYMMFRGSRITKAEDIDFSDVTNLQYAFYGTTKLLSICVVNAGGIANAGFLSHAFSSCRAVTIEKLRLNTTTGTFTNTFQSANYLENIVIDGKINRNGLSFQWSPLTHESLLSIINALEDYSADTSGTVWTITLGEANLEKLSTEELELIRSRGWEYG